MTLQQAALRLTFPALLLAAAPGKPETSQARPGPPRPRPVITVEAAYPGANAQVVADTVAAPIEQQVNGVENMLHMASRCADDGGYTLSVTFRPGVDVGRARLLVQQRVNLAQPALPDLVKRGVAVKERAAGVLLFVKVFSPDRGRDTLYLCNYANLHLREPLSRLPGVADVTCLGQ